MVYALRQIQQLRTGVALPDSAFDRTDLSGFDRTTTPPNEFPSMKIQLSLLIGLLLTNSVLLAAENPKPNILIIVSDDQGYADVGCRSSEHS